MGGATGPILTGIGMLQGGKLSDAGRAGYVESVTALLASGNENGGSPVLAPFSTLIGGKFPPVPGPPIPNVTTLSVENLFWFKKDPIAAVMATTLVDKTKCPIWNAIWPDGIVSTTAAALDLPGSTPLFPFFDVTLLKPDLGFPLALPDLAVKLGITPPQLLLKLPSLNILPPALPSIPSPPTLSLPSFGLPPDLALKAAIQIPQLILGLLKLPFDLLLKLVLPPDLGIVLKLIQFDLSAVFNLALNLLIQLLIDVGLLLITPKLLIASLLIWLKDIVSMVCVDIVGMLVGANGSLTKSVGIATGLIPPS